MAQAGKSRPRSTEGSQDHDCPVKPDDNGHQLPLYKVNRDYQRADNIWTAKAQSALISVFLFTQASEVEARETFSKNQLLQIGFDSKGNDPQLVGFRRRLKRDG